MELEGKRIVVSGGARGIGASAVRAFVREGAYVAVLDVLDPADEELAGEAVAPGPGHAVYVHCDISKRSDVTDALAAATSELGGLDALVNTAAIELRSLAEEIEDADWDATLDVNLRGTFLTNQIAFPYLRDNGGGRILNFASGAGLYPFIGGAHYSASKGAVISWTRTIAHEWGRHNITANAVCPVIWTPMYEASRARYSPEELSAHEARMADRIPLGGKSGDPDRDMAPVLVFLVGDGARFITAQIISVDGGMVPLR
jgi:NAD(P)-dependent dehydrogenase (short-subunit alcohol dehydrogenase family)